MKRCPTEAIRVRGGKAQIMYERCIGCGECVRHCAMHAKKEFYDSLEIIRGFKYKVAVPSPSLYAQFNNIYDTNYVLTALKNLGFDDVVEAAAGAEYVSAATAEYIKNTEKVSKPVISSACPAVVNLILMRYENLIDNLSPMQQPEEVASNMARAKAQMETGLSADEIGVFVITQCAANVMSLKQSQNTKVDGVLSVKEIYFPLLDELNKLTSKDAEIQKLALAGSLGVSWGASSGEANGLKTDNYLSADGIENVISVLNDLEHDRLTGLDFVELYACNLGCVGGSMNIESPFLARTRLRKLRNAMSEKPIAVTDFSAYKRKEPYESNNVFCLDENRIEAMRKTLRVKEIESALPGINCGSCGAPNCRALAEDLVRGIKAKCRYMESKK
jgi:iron only hydrogenase large subunit-like protein